MPRLSLPKLVVAFPTQNARTTGLDLLARVSVLEGIAAKLGQDDEDAAFAFHESIPHPNDGWHQLYSSTGWTATSVLPFTWRWNC